MNSIIKTRILIFFLIFVTTNILANEKYLLNEGDSLFKLRKYVDAKKIYEKLYYEKNYFSDAMLLKLSFIEEGIGNYEKALIYLSKHYYQTNNKETSTKIKSIAKKNELIGFEQNDLSLILNAYNKNIYLIHSILVVILVLYLIIGEKKDTSYHIRFMIISVLVLAIMNFNLTKKQGIVDQDNTYIMNGPSSGSDVYSIIKKGNKLKISKEYSIWYEVIFENKKKYIRKKNISLID
jgi:tetratricopeptide (TPR) repeat protein